MGKAIRSQFINRDIDKNQDFTNTVNEAIDKIQLNGNYAEVQYSTCYAGNTIMLSAFVIERENNQ
jgi:hypothetical protein